MMTYLRRAVAACALYPVTWTYVAGVAVIVSISEGFVAVGTGLVILSTLTVLIALISTRREVRKVHGLVNSQRDDLVDRIEQLTGALHDAGAAIPAKGKGSGVP